MIVTLHSKQKREIAYAFRHHARTLEPLASTLISRIALSTTKGEFGSRSNGPNSNFIRIDGMKDVYYLSGQPHLGQIWVRANVRPTYRHVTYVLKTRVDVHHFCDELGI
jgi:hypothetical protein